eukprot:scaffold660328_cov51-Prasinocladus_malaysianus.AAC.1
MCQAFDQASASGMEELEGRVLAGLNALRKELESKLAQGAEARDLEVCLGEMAALQRKLGSLERDVNAKDVCTRDEAAHIAADLLRKHDLQRNDEATAAAIR